ncbi:hypothetical protein [Altererythrobacter sp. GH1-8]|uniref:hypothetical protein n=1 Tax=Altererythrobacter sp. GH1-8 TaxID=3349333 RepID=UPI00374D425B
MSGTPAPNNTGETLAFKRFMVLNLIRVIGVVTVCAGIAIQEGLLPMPPILAYILVITGFLTFFFLPNWIAKGWRSEES